VDFFCLAILLLPLGVLLGIFLLLRRRYGSDRALIALVFSLIASAVPASLAWDHFLEELHNPVLEWMQVTTIDEPAIEISYHDGVGVFTETNQEAVQLTNRLPACNPDGSLASQYISDRVEIIQVEEPHIDLPLPVIQPTQQLIFDVKFPVALEQGASTSFALYENGEIWCVERFEQGGLSAGVAAGIGAFALLYVVGFMYVGGVGISLILAILVLEFLHRRQGVPVPS
jgi:hypothetical protein